MESRLDLNLSDNKQKIRVKSGQKNSNNFSNSKIFNNKVLQSNVKNHKEMKSPENNINISKKLINTYYLPILIKNNFNYIDTISEILMGKKIIFQKIKEIQNYLQIILKLKIL